MAITYPLSTPTSIGIESIAMGTPAMVWNNTDLPTYADNYLPQVSTQMAQPFKFTKHYTGRLINRLK